jgi:hypothetical protein
MQIQRSSFCFCDRKPMQIPPWLPPFVWTDYRVAVLFLVLVPLVLLCWAFFQKAEAMQHLLIIYWRVASLLAITVYLMIGSFPIGFLSGWFARILIPFSLWFWVDLNEEIADSRPSRLKLAFTSWRWGVSIYSLVGLLAQIPILRCAFMTTDAIRKDGFCRIWLEPAWGFREAFHATTRPGFLGFVGFAALLLYILYLCYFVVIRLGKQGRSATGQ